MDKVGSQKIWSYFDNAVKGRSTSNQIIRAGVGHTVSSYFELARKMAELQFMNRDYVLLFRGQAKDHRTSKGNSTIKPTMFRLNGGKIPSASVLSGRFERLRLAERELVERYTHERFLGMDRLKRHRVIRWAILQHYEVCRTPLLDMTHSLRVASSFATEGNETEEAYLFVIGVPNISGAITASSEAGMQTIRLSSACPPDAVRPHLQEGYLVGEYPEIADYEQHAKYSYYEMDFGRRMIAKFKFSPKALWSSNNFKPVPTEALYPKERRDHLLPITVDIRNTLGAEGE